MKNKEFSKNIISIINGNGDMKQIVFQIKKQGTEEQYQKAVSAIQRNSRYRKTLSSLYTNQNINDIFTAAYIPSLALMCGASNENIFKDVLFLLKFLLSNKNLISDFYKKKARFESLLLKGDMQNAKCILDEIYNATGTSFWYIEMKLLMLNISDYEEYRSYYESVKALAENEWVRNHIRLIKRRVNMRTNQKDYYEFLRKHFPQNSVNQEYNYYSAYIEFMYTESSLKLSEEKIGTLATMMHNFTLVDTVLFMERFLLTMVCIQESLEYRNLYDEFRKNFNGVDVQRSEDYQTVKEMFCVGRYKTCSLKCEELLLENSDRFEILDIYVKTMLVLDCSVSFKECMLSNLVSILLDCYIKDDGFAFGATFMDKSNHILRAMSSFNGYYELLNIISNTMYVKSTVTHPFWGIMVLKRPFCNGECDLFDNNIPSQGIVSCDWSYSFYKKAESAAKITQDEFSKKLKGIRDEKNTDVLLGQVVNGLDRFFLEEKIVVAFQENTERMRYLQAVQLYVQVLVEDILLATRCDIEQLSNELTEEKCVSLGGDISFYVFAATTDLNKQFRDTPSQTLFDSLYAILTKYGCNIPSDFINIPFKDKKLLYKFLELCCDDKVLTQSPCDLYGKEKLQEQEKILSYLYESTNQKRFYSMLDRVRGDLAEFNVRNLAQSVQLPRAKINTDWLSVEYDSDVATAYDQLQGLSYEQISDDETLFNIYKVMFYRCKEKYLTQVNKQLGTFIRHGVFINTIVEFLEKYGLFFPSGDNQEDEERLVRSEFIQKIPVQDHMLVFKALQRCCLKLFKDIEVIINSIFFTSEKNSREYTPIYIESRELKERIRKAGESNDDVEFIQSIKKALDEYVEEGLADMGNQIMKSLHNTFVQYISSVRSEVPEKYCSKIPIDELMRGVPEEIANIGEWFQVINDSKRICSIDGYLKERNEKYPDICINLSAENSLMRLSDLILLDIIMENLIRNVEVHSGFGGNHKEARTEILIEINQSSKRIKVVSANRLNGVDDSVLQRAITKINTIVTQPCLTVCNLDNSCSLNSTQSSESLQIHGVGLNNLGGMISKACRSPHILAKQEKDRFVIEVAFSYGECD